MLAKLFIMVGLVCCGASVTAAATEPSSQRLPEVFARPDRSILLDISKSGEQLLAVGERGIVLRSLDAGKTWRSLRTPTTRTLTAIARDETSVGVAVGHAGTLLRTADSGASWQRIDVPEAGSDALLGVSHVGEGRFFAYGAFGLFLESVDGGKTWKRHQILSEDFDRHISSVITTEGKKFLLVGETGTLARSSDGVNWKLLKSPYDGSWFGALTTGSGANLIFGMRGTVYRAERGAESWARVSIDTRQAITSGLQLSDGRVLLVGSGGLVAVSSDDGRTFRLLGAPGPASIARALQTLDGRTLVVSDRGLMPLTLNE